MKAEIFRGLDVNSTEHARHLGAARAHSRHVGRARQRLLALRGARRFARACTRPTLAIRSSATPTSTPARFSISPTIQSHTYFRQKPTFCHMNLSKFRESDEVNKNAPHVLEKVAKKKKKKKKKNNKKTQNKPTTNDILNND
jgi:hypothetical protein